MRIIAILLLLFAFSMAVDWEDISSSERACFNVTDTSGSAYDKASYQPWTIFDVAVPKNGSVWNGSLNAIDTDIFMYAENATHAFLFIPAMDAAGPQEYCVYLGGEDQQELSGVGYYYYDSAQGSWTSSGSVSFGSEMNVSSTGSQSYARRLTSTTAFQQYAKIRTAGLASGGYVSFGSYDSDTASKNLYSLNMNETGSWFSYDNNLYNGTVGESLILKRMGTSNQASIRGGIYDTSGSLLAEAFRGSLSAHNPTRTLVQADDGQVLADWILMGRTGAYTENYSVSTPVWDRMDGNISITAPSSSVIYEALDAVTYSAAVAKAYDNCTIYSGSTEIDVFTSLVPGQVMNGIIEAAGHSTGENWLTVSCYDSGTETHAYKPFTVAGAEAASLFSYAFGFDISACPSATVGALDACDDAHNISYPYPFAMVACYGLNMSANYSCLSAYSNYTKNNYTIFFAPSTFSYATASQVEHVGALFLYGGAKITPKVEVFSPVKFIYIPAQNKSRDCGVYYNSTTGGCSWWEGFVVNNASVYIADDDDNWFTAAGPGIEQFNINWSQKYEPYSVVPVFNGSDVLFPNGIYTRLNCYERDGYFIINARNTQVHTFTISVTGNSSYFQQVSTSLLFQNISLNGTTAISLSDEDSTLCAYNGEARLFLPFSMPDLDIDGYGIIPWVALLFSVILSAIVPFALFIAFIINDTYSIISVSQMATLAVFAIIGGFVNNSFSQERSTKHLIVIVCLAVGYISVISEYQDDAGIDLSAYVGILDSMKALMDSNSLWDFTTGLVTFVVQLFMLIFTLPALFVLLVYQLVGVISPPIANAAAGFVGYIALAFMAYFYLKAYEVITNRFRNV